jgi:hypothetical protein
MFNLYPKFALVSAPKLTKASSSQLMSIIASSPEAFSASHGHYGTISEGPNFFNS